MVSRQPLTYRTPPLWIALLLVVGLWVATLYKLHARNIILYIMPSSALPNAQDRPRIMIDTKKTQLYYKQNKHKFGNKADFDASNQLFGIVKDLSLNQNESVVLVGGTNNGQSSLNILQHCP
jgi:hypothetical protein